MLDSHRFVSSVRDLKSGDEASKPLFCPVAGLPHRLAFLAYCGVDVFDTVPLIIASEMHGYLTTTGILDHRTVRELPCTCSSCETDRRDKEALLKHNEAVAEAEMRLVRHAIEMGTLRELVETRARTDPWLVQNLRLMDLEAYELQEMYQPVKGVPFHAGSKESLTRPDILRWHRRIKQRYKKPDSARILVLIPCSAKKPYSTSQSHFRFRSAISSSGCARIVHEVIVTSPLGIVPRELELFYPAKDYDIPVTGHWDREEISLIQDLVTWLAETAKYDLVISHLGGETEFVAPLLPDFIDTSRGDAGSRDSLQRLETTLRERGQALMTDVAEDRNMEAIRSICRFQFGPVGDVLCSGAETAGRWPNVRIVRGGIQLGMLTGERGMISLTTDGGRILADEGAYCVEIDDFVPKGNLFAVGVEGAAPEIRVGDDVAVVHRGDLRAVGVARMCSAEMTAASRGEAVHIRHVA